MCGKPEISVAVLSAGAATEVSAICGFANSD